MFTDKWRYSWAIVLGLAMLLTASGRFARSQSKQVSPHPTADSYDGMVRRLEGGDLSIDFAELRMKYAASPRYDPEEGSDEVRDMYRKLNANDYEGALKAADAVLAKQYVNIDAHMVASAAYDALHDEAKAKLHHEIVVGLARSILNSGTGASTATAYKVISVEEEYALMRVLGLRPSKQSYLHEGTRSYDKMEMVNPKDNSTVTRFFDVTLSDQHMMKSLQH